MAGGRVGVGDDENSITDVTASDTPQGRQITVFDQTNNNKSAH